MLKFNYSKTGYSSTMEFVVEPGKKFYKIVKSDNQRSVHAFIDMQSGDIYKPASWKAPAKCVRFNIIKYYDKLHATVTWCGSWLYR